MKNLTELQDRFRAELDQWYIKQCRNPFQRYYLYHLKTTSEHDGGILISADNGFPYQLSTPEAIRKDFSIDQNMSHFLPVLSKLPVLSINS